MGGDTKVDYSEILKTEFVSLLLLGYTVYLELVFYDLLQLFIGQISDFFWAIKYSYRTICWICYDGILLLRACMLRALPSNDRCLQAPLSNRSVRNNMILGV
jgi:hypothetical protein